MDIFHLSESDAERFIKALDEQYASREWMRENFTFKEIDTLRYTTISDHFKGLENRMESYARGVDNTVEQSAKNTDHKIEDFSRLTYERFKQVQGKIEDFSRLTDERFKAVDSRFQSVDTRLTAIQQSMITPAAFFATIATAVSIIIAAIKFL